MNSTKNLDTSVVTEVNVWYCNNSKSWVVTCYDYEGNISGESLYSYRKVDAKSIARQLCDMTEAKLVVENRSNTTGVYND
jgi:hypothetical protein